MPTIVETKEQMLKWFAYQHLPLKLQEIGQLFFDVATDLCEMLEPGPERTEALRKLLEAKDAAVRATVIPGG